MTPELLQWICCPACKGDFTMTVAKTSEHGIEEGVLACTACVSSYPITRGVPRFVQSDGYVQSFSYEWNRFNRVQLDPANGTTESEDTFIEKTGLTAADLKGKLVLDVGCGAGRFSEVVSRWGGRVIGIDFSFAVEASQRNLKERGTVDIIQADVFNLPLRPEIFDVIFSIGVLHHTRDTREAFLRLPALLKEGGTIAVWLYYYTDQLYNAATDFWRRIFTRVPSQLAYAWCWLLVALFSPLYRANWFHQAPFWHLPRLLPVNTHPNFQWRVLDTFDWLTPVYQDKDCSPWRVIGWYREAGLRGIQVLDHPTSIRGVRDDRAILPTLLGDVPNLDNVRIAIFGSGAGGHEAIRTLRSYGLADNVVAVFDNSMGKHGTIMNGIQVTPLDWVARDAYDFVVIASLPGRVAISRQLDALGLKAQRDYGSVEFLTGVALPIHKAAA
jgi:SAM-dependent methyltransferase/uncharacterized protein YbaR (Trm112 family)